MTGQKKVKVTLTVAMSEADVGEAAKAGDQVEVDADVAERWVAAGIAEAGVSAGAASAPAGKPDAGRGGVPRRGGSS